METLKVRPVGVCVCGGGGCICERGQRGADKKGINRALMVCKYLSGMGLWNAGVTQTRALGAR